MSSVTRCLLQMFLPSMVETKYIPRKVSSRERLYGAGEKAEGPRLACWALEELHWGNIAKLSPEASSAHLLGQRPSLRSLCLLQDLPLDREGQAALHESQLLSCDCSVRNPLQERPALSLPSALSSPGPLSGLLLIFQNTGPLDPRSCPSTSVGVTEGDPLESESRSSKWNPKPKEGGSLTKATLRAGQGQPRTCASSAPSSVLWSLPTVFMTLFFFMCLCYNSDPCPDFQLTTHISSHSNIAL